MKGINRFRNSGFSLLEVMIAVVVLATGLLALAALQGSLTRSSAEAKVRGRVAALLTARMDELRASQYANATTLAPDGCNVDLGANDWVPASFCTEAGIGAITATQTVTLYSSTVGAGSFSTSHTPVAGDPEFKQVELTATWTDADASSHRLALKSQLSDLTLRSNPFPPPATAGTSVPGPVVREDNPATAGVIPIALGDGNSSAASNPQPELVGRSNNQTLVGTKFNVLTYTPAGAAAVIQKRFENTLVKCSCQFGAGGTNFSNLEEIYRTAQWPAVWTGDRYDVYQPNPAAAAPGQALESAPTPGVDQSPVCQECCRDHHDVDNVTDVARFDPERDVTSVSTRYIPNGSGGLVSVPPSGTNKTYLDSCRIIRVDGFQRTASDMYSRQYGLLETQTVSGKQAATGLPTTTATSAYESFVKNYVKGYQSLVATTGTAPDPSSTYPATVPNSIHGPATVSISAPSNSDYRYLHARGLYVDYLEQKARNRLVSVLADTGAGGRCDQTTTSTPPHTPVPLEDCILPYLPFTTINLTELAKWTASDTSILTVNSQNQLATDPAQPSGGRTLGVKVGSADNLSSIRRSNSGVAASSTIAGGVDPADVAALGSDTQGFEVGGVTSTGDHFDVRITGGGLNPFVFYSIIGDTGECFKPVGGDYRCNTNTTLGSLGGTVELKNYWVLTTVATPTNTALGGVQCTYNGSPVTVATNGQNANIDVPAFRNYEVTSASINAVNGTIAGSVNDNKLTESTTVTFGSIPANSLALIGLTEQTGSPTLATLVSCTATKQGSNYYFNPGTAVWSKPWEQP